MKKLFIYLGVLFLSINSRGMAANFAPVEDAWSTPNAKEDFYRVHKGDTLYSIAWAFDMDYQKLAQFNNLKPPYDLHTGQILQMQASAAPSQASKSDARPHTPPSPQKVINPTFSNTPVKHWAWPAQGRVAKAKASWTSKKGIDILGTYGDAIKATAPGIVVYSGQGVRGYGQMIIIKHNNDYLSAYAFNKNLLVQVNDRVSGGQVIATMGKRDQTSMLHFEIRHHGKSVNPLKLLAS